MATQRERIEAIMQRVHKGKVQSQNQLAKELDIPQATLSRLMSKYEYCFDEDGPYIILSHEWPDDIPFELEANSLDIEPTKSHVDRLLTIIENLSSQSTSSAKKSAAPSLIKSPAKWNGKYFEDGSKYAAESKEITIGGLLNTPINTDRSSVDKNWRLINMLKALLILSEAMYEKDVEKFLLTKVSSIDFPDIQLMITRMKEVRTNES